MSALQDYQAPSSIYNDEECHHEYQDNRHVSIFGKEAYIVITASENTSLQLGYKFIVFTVPYACQPSHEAI
jgi:hypothetical protein